MTRNDRIREKQNQAKMNTPSPKYRL